MLFIKMIIAKSASIIFNNSSVEDIKNYISTIKEKKTNCTFLLNPYDENFERKIKEIKKYDKGLAFAEIGMDFPFENNDLDEEIDKFKAYDVDINCINIKNRPIKNIQNNGINFLINRIYFSDSTYKKEMNEVIKNQKKAHINIIIQGHVIDRMLLILINILKDNGYKITNKISEISYEQEENLYRELIQKSQDIEKKNLIKNGYLNNLEAIFNILTIIIL